MPATAHVERFSTETWDGPVRPPRVVDRRRSAHELLDSAANRRLPPLHENEQYVTSSRVSKQSSPDNQYFSIQSSSSESPNSTLTPLKPTSSLRRRGSIRVFDESSTSEGLASSSSASGRVPHSPRLLPTPLSQSGVYPRYLPKGSVPSLTGSLFLNPRSNDNSSQSAETASRSGNSQLIGTRSTVNSDDNDSDTRVRVRSSAATTLQTTFPGSSLRSAYVGVSRRNSAGGTVTVRAASRSPSPVLPRSNSGNAYGRPSDFVLKRSRSAGTSLRRRKSLQSPELRRETDNAALPVFSAYGFGRPRAPRFRSIGANPRFHVAKSASQPNITMGESSPTRSLRSAGSSPTFPSESAVASSPTEGLQAAISLGARLPRFARRTSPHASPTHRARRRASGGSTVVQEATRQAEPAQVRMPRVSSHDWTSLEGSSTNNSNSTSDGNGPASNNRNRSRTNNASDDEALLLAASTLLGVVGMSMPSNVSASNGAATTRPRSRHAGTFSSTVDITMGSTTSTAPSTASTTATTTTTSSSQHSHSARSPLTSAPNSPNCSPPETCDNSSGGAHQRGVHSPPKSSPLTTEPMSASSLQTVAAPSTTSTSTSSITAAATTTTTTTSSSIAKTTTANTANNKSAPLNNNNSNAGGPLFKEAATETIVAVSSSSPPQQQQQSSSSSSASGSSSDSYSYDDDDDENVLVDDDTSFADDLIGAIHLTGDLPPFSAIDSKYAASRHQHTRRSSYAGQESKSRAHRSSALTPSVAGSTMSVDDTISVEKAIIEHTSESVTKSGDLVHRVDVTRRTRLLSPNRETVESVVRRSTTTTTATGNDSSSTTCVSARSASSSALQSANTPSPRAGQHSGNSADDNSSSGGGGGMLRSHSSSASVVHSASKTVRPQQRRRTRSRSSLGYHEHVTVHLDEHGSSASSSAALETSDTSSSTSTVSARSWSSSSSRTPTARRNTVDTVSLSSTSHSPVGSSSDHVSPTNIVKVIRQEQRRQSNDDAPYEQNKPKRILLKDVKLRLNRKSND